MMTLRHHLDSTLDPEQRTEVEMLQTINKGFVTCLETTSTADCYVNSGLYLAFALVCVERTAISKVRTKEGTDECN